ncbi:MAG: DUF3592 domain-containing protein [Phototrophicaceae bacterium]
MHNPLFERAEIFYIGRKLGALLVLFGGLALIVQSYFGVWFPETDGFLPLTATVIDREQIGSFQNPSFLVTLAYAVPQDDAPAIDQVRSGQQVEFEQYFGLSVGQVVDIVYNPQNWTEWRINNSHNDLSEYGLGLLMVLFGGFSLLFPTIVRWASRQEDFEFKDELDNIDVSGVNTN